MIAAADRTVLGEVSHLIAKRLGLHFPEERWPDLLRGLRVASQELGFEAPDACLSWLRTQELTVPQLETLASHLTVGETYFFRDPASFEALEREILRPLVAERGGTSRTLRLWSAGCCTGEEAYSLAITCARVLPDPRGWNVTVLATDINPKFLAKAEAGVYSDWSFRGTPGWIRDQYFSPVPGKKAAIDPSLKGRVHFGYLNLAEDAYPSLHNHTNAMDVIFCRNVLMYFTPEHQRRVVAALHRCLVDGGCLLVNPAEACSSLFPMFVSETVAGVQLYRKTTRPPRAEPWPGQVTPALAPDVLVTEPAAPVPTSDFSVEPVAPEFASALVIAPTQAVPAVAVAPSQPPAQASAAPMDDPLVRARTCANQGRLEEALASCQAAIAAERTSSTAYFLYGTICHELGRLEEAIAAQGKVLYLEPDFVLAHHALGSLYRQLGMHGKSRRHLEVAFEILSKKSRDELVPESDGMTCGRLVESVRAMRGA